MVYFLIGLMSLAHQHDDIVLLCVCKCPVDRLRTIDNDLHRRIRILHALENIIDDGLRLLGARIIARYNAEIREIRRNFTHLRALGAVTVAAAAEQSNDTALCKAANGLEHVLHAVRRVCVVDEHGVIGIGRHDLNTALDAGCSCHGLRRIRKRHAELQHDTERGQCILDREMTRNRQLDVCLFALILCGELHAVRVQLQVGRFEIGLRLAAGERHARALCVREHLLRRSIIQIDNALLADGEQQRLCLAILLHGLVEIEVILRQIGERAYRKRNAVYAVKHQGVRGNLHDHMRAACVSHAGKQCVQLVGFRRGALGFDHFITDEVLVGADQADLVPCVLKHVLDEVGRGGLAVGAGHTEHDHALCRMTEAVCRNLSQRDTGILHNDCGDALRRLLADNGCRALLHRLGDVLVAVGRVAADGYKQVARLYRAGVVTHFLDLDILCGSAVFYCYILQKFL